MDAAAEILLGIGRTEHMETGRPNDPSGIGRAEHMDTLACNQATTG